MKFDRNAASGAAERIREIRPLKRWLWPGRCILRKRVLETCCSERSKYGTPVTQYA